MKTVDFAKMSAVRNHEMIGLLIPIKTLCITHLTGAELELSQKFMGCVDEMLSVINKTPDVSGADVSLADSAVDETLSAITKFAEVTSNHPNPARAEVARRVKAIIDSYGNLTRLQLKEQYAKVHTMLRDLSAIDRSDLALAYMDEWIDELQARYDQFMQLSSQHVQAVAMIGTGKVKAARDAAIESLHTLTTCISAIHEMNPNPSLSLFIDEINVLMDQMRATMKQRRTTKKKRKDAAEAGGNASEAEGSPAGGSPNSEKPEAAKG